MRRPGPQREKKKAFNVTADVSIEKNKQGEAKKEEGGEELNRWITVK